MVIIISGGRGGQPPLILQTFIIHTPNSYVVLPMSPLTVVLKKTPGYGDAFTSIMFPFTSPGVWSSSRVNQSPIKQSLVRGTIE
jgi:hypothetical protein